TDPRTIASESRICSRRLRGWTDAANKGAEKSRRARNDRERGRSRFIQRIFVHYRSKSRDGSFLRLDRNRQTQKNLGNLFKEKFWRIVCRERSAGFQNLFESIVFPASQTIECGKEKIRRCSALTADN